MPETEPAARPFSPVLARPSDPETSHAAADSVLADGTVETHERRILSVLGHELRDTGGTASEIAAAVRGRYRIENEIAFCAHTVCRRLCALRTADLIHRRLDRARMAATHWRVARESRDDARRLPILYLARGGETIYWLGSEALASMPLFRSAASAASAPSA